MSRFSLRTAFPRTPNPLSQAVAERHARGLPLLDLAETNPTRVGLPPPDVDLGALSEPFRYTPEPFGLPTAREAVAAHLRQRGASVEAAHVVLSASTSEAYGWLLKLLCDPGDHVLLPAPGYPLVDVLARLEGVQARSYRLPAVHGFGLDAARVEGCVDARTRAVVVVNPGNPTGHFLHEGELHALADVCARHGLALICDEVFSGFAWDEEAGRVTSVAGRRLPCLTFSLSGLSKVAGLPGLKLAWLHVGGPAHARDEALARLEDVADAALSVATPVQLALPSLLAHAPRFQQALLNRVKGNRERLLRARPADAAWDVVRSHGGWSAVLRIPHHPGEEATCLRLLEEGVRVQPGYFHDFGGGAYLVLSLLPTPEVFTAALVPLSRVLSPSAGR